MREVATRARIETFRTALSRAADVDVDLFLVGGTSAVVVGWRDSTMDLDFGHARDLLDVRAMLDRGLVTREGWRSPFSEIEQLLYRYPAIDPATFRQAVDDALGPQK